MSNPFFSVIVPAHNSERFIMNCLRSISVQTFKDYELIIVCDSCTDNTEALARIMTDKVIVTDFGTDGLARNAGLDAATGEWVVFLDDDDWWIHEYVLEELHRAAERVGPFVDILTMDFIWKDPPEGIPAYYRNERGEANIAVWSKAFRRDVIGETRFPPVKMTSDLGFMMEIMRKQPRAYATNMLAYYYNFMRKGSQTEQYERRKAEGQDD